MNLETRDDSTLKKEEQRLVDAAKLGDLGAISTIYQKYQPSIHRFLSHKLGDRDLAQDKTTDVFIRAIVNIGRYEHKKDSISPWLFKIARNIATDHFRRQNGEISLNEDFHRSPDNEIDEDDLFWLNQIRGNMRNLEADQQEVLNYKFFGDLTNPEVARIMGRSEGAVKSLQHRALAALSREVDPKPKSKGVHMETAPDLPEEILYSFNIALNRFPAHSLHEQLRFGNEDMDKNIYRWDLWKSQIVPFIDSQLLPIEKKALYMLIYQQANIDEIKLKLDRNYNINKVFSSARKKIIDHLNQKNGLEFEELYQLFRYTDALYAISRILPSERRNLGPNQTKNTSLRLRSYLYPVLRLDQADLTRLFGENGSSQIIDSSLVMMVKGGVDLPIIKDSWIIVHRHRVEVSALTQKGEIRQFNLPVIINAGEGHEILEGNTFLGDFNQRAQNVHTIDPCLIRIIHPEAIFPADKAQVIARRRQILDWYSELPLVNRTRQYKIIYDQDFTDQIKRLISNTNLNGDLPTDLVTLKRAYSCLTLDQKKILKLSLVEGLSDQEIGQMLARRNDNIRDIKTRAYRKIDQYMREVLG